MIGYVLILIFSLIVFYLMPGVIAVYLVLFLAGCGVAALILIKHPELISERTESVVFKLLLIIFAVSAVMLGLKNKMVFLLLLFLPAAAGLYFGKKRTAATVKSGQKLQESRRALRTDMCFDIEIKDCSRQEDFSTALTKDLSTTGLKLYNQQPLTIGGTYSFRLHLPQESWPVTGKLQVIWVKTADQGYESGCIFVRISEQDRGKLALKQGFSLLE